MPSISHVIEDFSPGSLRLDRYVSENLKLLPRSQIKRRNLKVKLNGKEVKLSRLIKSGDQLELCWDELPPLDIMPEDLPLEIIWEDDRCVVINKAQGMVVHPGAGNRQGTLANALYYRMFEKGKLMSDTNKNCSLRPGIVHRLDKETSGLIIAAWDEETHAFLSEQFKTRKVKKNYIAIVCGVPKEKKGRIETCIARAPNDRKLFTVSPKGKHAVTFYKVLKQWQNHSLLLLRPKTGRTHQLRVHLRHLGHPVLGDPLYGFKDSVFPNARLMLHSKRLAITIPGETEQRIFSSGTPERFHATIDKLNERHT